MFNRLDFDAFLCLIGWAVISATDHIRALADIGISTQSIAVAKSHSILVTKFHISDTLFITPNDCIQILGAIVGIIGVCNFLAKLMKKAKVWYTNRQK